tara:strand:- start:5328 stop:5474 length:147 start_codon:yes stop_codon:yes gene_type:complete
MAVKKRKLVPPSPEGGTKPKAEPSKSQNRIKLGSGVTLGSKAKLGVKT